jgi:hypothetical protein
MQTSSSLSKNIPRKRRLLAQNRSLETSLAKHEASSASPDSTISHDEFIKFCESHFNEGTANFIKTQLYLSRTKGTGRRYNDQLKKFAITIYFLGPTVYRMLSKTFGLPSKATLCRITSKWPVTSGLNHFVFIWSESTNDG